MPRINDLPALIADLPPEIATICGRLFRVSVAHGHLVAPETMRSWIGQHFGDEQAASDQQVIKITNLLTLEATLFNPLRGKRPHDKGIDADLEESIATSLATHDIFRTPLVDTPADTFGRIKGDYCITASNIAKYDGWHGVVIFDEPHPLRFGLEQVRDYLQTAWRWLHAAHASDPAAQYPIVTWNCLWKSGASIVHGHIQMALASDAPYAAIERWQRAARDYRVRYGNNYFEDLKLVYEALGLVFTKQQDVTGYVALTPLKSNEILLTAPLDERETVPEALVEATYCALRRLIDDLEMRSFNLTLYPPPFSETALSQHELPWCVRIVDRGNPASRMVDIGAMELFGTPVVSSDPFVAVEALREGDIAS